MIHESTMSSTSQFLQMGDAGVRWSELPSEIWSAVGKRLNNYIDVLRFRSVCRSWRSSLPPFQETSPPPRLRFPSSTTAESFSVHVFLSQSTVYRLSPLHPQPSPNDSSSCSSTRPNGRLVKLEKLELPKMRLLHPLSKRQIGYNLKSVPDEQKEFNLLDTRIDKLATSYSLKFTDDICVPGIAKVVVAIPNSEECTIIAVYEGGKLGFARLGDEKWNLIDEQNFHYDDVIVHNRQYYAVDKWGTIFWIDSSMRLVQFSPPLIGLGHRKHLVECGGELLVIDRFVDQERQFRHPIHHIDRDPVAISKAIDFKAYKLDQEWGRWVEVKNLGNLSIILGNDCSFSVEASKFDGCIQNCIYFSDSNDDEFSVRSSIRVFDLEGGRIGKILAYPGIIDIFSRPPIWLSKSLPPLKDINFQHRHEN
ncbi:putative F-box protein At1g65770 [Momordica charantia]|uniref:F-box protein At1g65770 n=1 Tax=Momordica charantia TaxID=3673 RepID=A0A6J1BTY2_MOMCH|nr:putative F-box protein At1g65770 [Momordica charantia]